MDQDGVFASHLVLELSDGFQKGLSFDVTYGSAHLDNCNAHFVVGVIAVKPAFDLIGDMRDHLHCAAAVIAVPFLLQDGPVHFTGGDVGVFIQTFIDKALVVSQVQIGLTAVVGDKYFAVLDGIHGAGINVDIRVEFLHGHFKTAGLQQPAQRCRRDAFSQAGNHAACNKNIFYHDVPPLPIKKERKLPFPGSAFALHLLLLWVYLII